MLLAYIYIADYGMIKNQEFNFLPQFHFEYDEKKDEVVVEENKNYYNIFNSDSLKNITVVVGENGSGKSTLLDFIKVRCRNEISFLKDSQFHIIIYYDENNNLFITNANSLQIGKDIKQGVEYFEKNRKEQVYISNSGRCMDVITYTEYFDVNKVVNQFIKPQPDKYDISVAGRLRDYYDGKNRNNDNLITVLKNLKHGDMKRQLSAWDDSISTQFAIHNMLITVPDYKKELKKVLEDLFGYIRGNETGSDAANYIEQHYQYKSMAEHIDNIFSKWEEIVALDISYALKGVLYSILVRLLYKDNGKYLGITHEVISKWNYNISNNFQETMKDVEILINDTKNELSKINLLYYDIDKLCQLYIRVYDVIKNDFFEKNNSINNVYNVSLDHKDNIEHFRLFYHDYIEAISDIYDFLEFEWEISSGEKAYFDLYSQLKAVSSSDAIKNDCILLIDEVDLFIHPRWQQEYIYRLKNIIDTAFIGKNIQVILTTHSPILLSDIPNNNIIYLKNCENVSYKKANNKTLAANIYSLYQDNFFMNIDDDLWLCGKYAKKIIREILQNPDENAKHKWNKISAYIGDEFVKELVDRIILMK